MGGLRDIVLAAVMVGFVPISLTRPWIGVLGWFWIAYMVPHSFTWGFARTLPLAAVVGGATLVGLLLTRDKKRLRGSWTTLFASLFVIHITATTVAAFNPELAWMKWEWIVKSLLMTGVTICLFQDRTRLRSLYLVTALSLGVHAVKGGLWVLRTGGVDRVYGPDQSFFADNNTFGLALCMALPLLLYLSREETRPWLKRVLQGAFGMSIIATLFTYSRGAFVGLVVILSVVIWRSPWRLRFAATALVVALVVVPILPSHLKDRIASISDQESAETRDSSVAGRFYTWGVAWDIAVAHPFMGGGFLALLNQELGDAFTGGNYVIRNAHSVYFEVLSEHGFLGFALYVSILLSTLASLRRLRKRWRDHPEHAHLSRYAEMTQLSIYSFLVAGAFINVAYFDLYSLLVGTSVILNALSAEAETSMEKRVDESDSAVPRTPLLGRRPRRPLRPELGVGA